MVTQSATTNGVVNTDPVTVVITSVNTNQPTTQVVAPTTSTSSAATSTSSTPAALSGGSGSGASSTEKSSGLGTAGVTAIAVVVPVVVVALLLAAGIFLWRRRKQNREAQEARKQEIHDYHYNPNDDPTLPSVANENPEMTQDSGNGYRGWGAAAASNRKASTTLSGGHTQGQPSESGNSYGHSPGSPGATGSDGHSGDPLVNNRRETMGSDDLGALGAAPATAGNKQGIRRGPSNASSAYSNGARSEGSEEPMPAMPGQAYDYNPSNQYGYSQHGPYGDGSYGGAQDSGMPVVRDVSARRNTRIQQAGTYQQGNSGIAQNF